MMTCDSFNTDSAIFSQNWKGITIGIGHELFMRSRKFRQFAHSQLALWHRSCRTLPYLRDLWGLESMVLTFLLDPLVSYLKERVHLVISWLVFLQSDNTGYNVTVVNIFPLKSSIRFLYTNLKNIMGKLKLFNFS